MSKSSPAIPKMRARCLGKIQELKTGLRVEGSHLCRGSGNDHTDQRRGEQIKEVEGLHTISALTHRQIVELVERKVIQAEAIR